LPQQRSIEIKVGIFVLLCVGIAATLIIKFGKLEKFSSDTYPITVVFPNVGGIVRDASVMYAGIPVGKVRDIKLTEVGALQVHVTLAIYKSYTIRRDAKFVINQSGLLGDRYVDVIPRSATAAVLKSGDEVTGESSVDLTEAIRGVVDVLRAAAGTVARVDELIRRTDAAIKRVDETILNTQTLAHVSSSLANIDAVTSNAVGVTAGVRSVVDESRQSISNTLSEFSLAAGDVREASKHVQALVVSHEDELSATASNLAAGTARLNAILENLQKGDGTAGRLLTDPTLHDELVKLVQNWRKYGILYKDKNVRPVEKPK
jgi:phospholipid/cholesterol/gamma-HCH transport system substrate-binding protein